MLLVSRETSLGVLLFKSTYVTILAVCVTVSPSFMRFVNLTFCSRLFISPSGVMCILSERVS